MVGVLAVYGIMRLLLLFLRICQIMAIVPINEINFLSDLYYATDGQNWLWKPTRLAGVVWNFNDPNINPCSTNSTRWQGIECDNSPIQCASTSRICHITAVRLEAYRLKGTLPDRWNELPRLQHIDLGLNNLKGTFPTTLVPPLQLNTFFIEVNSLTGTLPDDIIGQMTSLMYLDLSNNGFTGPFPSQLGSLTLLEHLEFRQLAVTGGIPSSIGNLQALTMLDFTGCWLTGTLPSQLGNLTSMIFLDMDFNLLSGTIPSTLGSLHAVTLLDLSYNLLSGPIPSSFGSLTSMSKINLQYNMLTGFIPSSLGSMSQTIDFFLFMNYLSGPIPSSLASLTRMTTLDLLNNYLTGQIPLEIWNLTKLELLNLGTNCLTGTLPPVIGGLSRISWLNLLVNRISGTIPQEINNLKFLKYLYLGYNLFSGPMLCDSKFLTITILDLELNYLTGTICPTFARTITDIRLDSNQLTGTLPSQFGLLNQLENLKLDRNYLHGEIPSEFKNMSTLISFTASHNRLSGCFPSELGYLRNLRQLYLQSNSFHCGLKSVLFDPSAMNWVNIDLSDNMFTSTLPPSLFQIPTLETIVLTSNCFHGTLPSDVCQTKSLKVLSCDGLGASSDCPRADLLSIRRDRLLDGTIPDCLWLLENLTTVSLSGNGLIGTIGELSPNSILQNLTLSHNKLSGTIPKSIQQHPFLILDLSFNRFLGEVNNLWIRSFAKKTQIILEVNRLSGVLQPLDKEEKKNLNPSFQFKLNIVSGNLFSCDYLPRNDQSYGEYICGSQDLDRSMIVLGSILFLIIMAVCLVWFVLSQYKKKQEYRQSWLYVNWNFLIQYLQGPPPSPSSSSPTTSTSRISEFLLNIRNISQLIVILATISFFLLLPFYILRVSSMRTTEEEDQQPYRYAYSTHTHLYRWSWSIVHSTGSLPSAFIIATWFICCLVFVIGSQILDPQRQARERGSPLVPSQQQQLSTYPTTFVLFRLFVDITIISGVNAAYIYSTTRDITSRIQFLIKICLAIFNFLWSEGFSRSSHVVLYISYAIFKNILIPCLATAFTSTSCFQNLLIPPKRITSYYEYAYCGVYRIVNTNREGSASSIVDCVENVPFSASVKPFTPPFTYNYICFSTILKAYLPVFIYTYCLKIVIPICVSYLVVNYLPYESLPTWIRDHTRGILWPLYWKKYSSSLSGDNTLSTLHRGGRSLGAGSTLQEDLKKEEEDPSRDLVRPNSIFKPSQTYGSIAQDICLLLTFGLCSPVLALAIAMHATLSSYHIRILITRFLYLQHSPPSPPSPPSIAIHALEKSLIGISNALSLMVWPIIWSSCFFIVFLCWEISGDAVGWKKSGWVPLTILILAVILYLVTTRPTFILKVELLVQYLENRFNIHVMNPHPHPHRSPPSHDVVDSMELVNSPSFSASQF